MPCAPHMRCRAVLRGALRCSACEPAARNLATPAAPPMLSPAARTTRSAFSATTACCSSQRACLPVACLLPQRRSKCSPPPAQIIRMHGTDAHVCLAPSASPSSRSTLACAHHCEWHSRQIGWRAQTSADGSHNRARESPELHTPCGSVRLLHWLTPVQASTLRHQAGSGLHSERCSALCAAVRGTSIIARRPLPTDDNT